MLSFNQIGNGITINKNIIKLHNKNQIFPESVLDENTEIIWVLEQYEFTDHNGTDMFSVFDGFHLLEDAISIGMRLNDNANQQLNPHKQKTNGEICDKLEICENHTNL